LLKVTLKAEVFLFHRPPLDNSLRHPSSEFYIWEVIPQAWISTQIEFFENLSLFIQSVKFRLS
jgi:hypothetical protein